MTKAPRVRASALPLLRKCAQAAKPQGDGVTIDAYHEAAPVGTAVHECLEQIVHGKKPAVNEIARRNGVDFDEVDRLVRFSERCWQEVADYFPDPETEVAMSAEVGDWKLTGHADLISRPDPATVCILDFKTGWALSDYSWQVMGYALLAAHRYPDAETFSLTLLHTRHGIRDTVNIGIDEVSDFELALAERLETVGDDSAPYSPGEHCAHCPRFMGCEARAGMIRDTIVTLEGTHENTGFADKLLADDREKNAALIFQTYDKVKAIEKMCKSYIKMVRQDIERNGPLPTGDGKQLALIPSKRDAIDAEAAAPILEEILQPEDFRKIISIKKGPLLDIVGERTERGNKGAAKDAVMERLREADAIKQTPIVQLRVVKQPEATGDQT